MANSYFKKFNSAGIAFMDERTRGDVKTLCDGAQYHICSDFGFIKSKQNTGSDYAVFCVEEIASAFFFGGAAVTSTLHQIDTDGMRDELQLEPVTFETYKSNYGTEGIAVRFSE